MCDLGFVITFWFLYEVEDNRSNEEDECALLRCLLSTKEYMMEAMRYLVMSESELSIYFDTVLKKNTNKKKVLSINNLK